MILASPMTRVQWVQENLIPEVAATVCCVDDNFFSVISEKTLKMSNFAFINAENPENRF